jgi:two-component system, sporulation sensor kinase E
MIVMHCTLRKHIFLIKVGVLLLVTLLVAWGVGRHFRLHPDQLSTAALARQALLLALLPLLLYGVLELLLFSSFVNIQKRYLRKFAQQIQHGSVEPLVYPELQPVVDTLQNKEKQLQRESSKILWIVKHIPGGLLTINQQEQITLAACPAFEDLGLPVGELVGKPVSEFHRLIGLERHNSLLLDALHQGIKSRRISRVRDHYFEAVNTPMVSSSNGAITGAVCLFVDVTERVRHEQEMKRLERLSLVGQMAASLSHEIRNPLAVIRGFLQLHSRRAEHQPAKEQFELLLGEIDRVSHIVQAFLELSHSGGGEWRQQPLDQVVQQLAPLLSSEAAIHGIALQLDLQPTPELLMCRNDIKQLLLNLYRNAIEACEGNGTVSVSTGVSADGHPFLRVQDDGCGMPQQVLERLGTPFNSTKANGTGLGLPLCLSVAEAHSAELSFQPASRRGTVASVLFPVPQSEAVAVNSN